MAQASLLGKAARVAGAIASPGSALSILRTPTTGAGHLISQAIGNTLGSKAQPVANLFSNYVIPQARADYSPTNGLTFNSGDPNALNGTFTLNNNGGGSNGSGGYQPGQNGYVNPNTGQPSGGGDQGDPYASIKAEISGAWDNYIGSLNDLMPGLNDQRTSQENIANTQYQTGVDQINSQKASSLRDITDNISNAFKAGNIYLGSRGAGDSSAANQYQYALSKEAAKQTGQLNEFVNGQMNTLKGTYDTQINQIAQWFSEAQNNVKQMIASGQLSKAQDINNLSRSILDQAIAQKNQIAQNAQNRYNALLEWAAGNSTNIGQLKSNIAAIPQAIGAPQIDSTGNLFVAPTGYGTNDKKQNSLFQNPAWF